MECLIQHQDQREANIDKDIHYFVEEILMIIAVNQNTYFIPIFQVDWFNQMQSGDDLSTLWSGPAGRKEYLRRRSTITRQL